MADKPQKCHNSPESVFNVLQADVSAGDDCAAARLFHHRYWRFQQLDVESVKFEGPCLSFLKLARSISWRHEINFV